MINKDFFEALKDLEVEYGIPQEVMINKLEQAMTAALKKNSGEAKCSLFKLSPEKHTIKVYSYKTVVEEVEDDFFEIDIWFDNGCFVVMYYKFDGTFRHYETNDF